MMAAGHVATGVTAGVYVTALLHTGESGALLAAALVCAGASLLPDLDHEHSTATHTFGAATRIASARVAAFSRWTYVRTRSRWDWPDPDRADGRRGPTHTLVAAVLAGLGAWVVARVGPVLVVFPLACMAVRGIMPDLQKRIGGSSPRLLTGLRHPVGSAVLGGVATWFALGHLGDPVWIGVLVGLGCFVHCLGDSLTLAGCPWLWPLPILGRRWFRIGLPRPLRFRTGGRIEALLVTPALVLGTLVLGGLLVAPHLLAQLLP